MNPWRAAVSAGLYLALITYSTGEEPNAKAARYHSLLLKRPASGTLLERFVDAWLDEGTKEGLEAFLKEQAEAGEGAAGWGVLATYQEWAGREQEALAAIGKALEELPGDPKLLLARAKLRAGVLDYEGALADIEAAGDADESVAEEAATLRGTYLARAGKPEEAVEVWKAMLENRPGDEELREDLIELEVGEGLFDEAIKTSRTLAESSKDPYQKALRLLRTGSIEIMAGRKDDGLATYEQIVTMTGEDSWLEREVLAQVETAFLSSDDVTGLRQFYQKLRETFPQRVSLRKGLARQMAANGEVSEAVDLFREILAITPGDTGNRSDFISLLETAGRHSDAATELEVLIRDDSENPELWERMVKLRDLAGEQEAADNALVKVRELRSTTPAGVVQTAVLFQSYDRDEQSETILREGRVNFPDDPEITEALAALLAGSEESEKQAEATEIWKAMAAGEGADVLLGAARSLLAHGQPDTAFDVLFARADDFPEDKIFLTQLGQAGLSSGKIEEAFPYALDLARLAADPTDMDAALKLVRALGRGADLGNRIDELIALPDKTVADWCILSELQEELGDTAAAESALTEAEALDDGLLAASQRVRLLQSRGDMDGAADAMAALIERPGGARPVYYRKLVGILVSAGRREEALDVVDVWKRASPGDESAWLRRAELLGEAGRPDEVVQELRRALAQFGDSEDLQARMATALFEAGDAAGAERAFRKLYDSAEDRVERARWIRSMAELADREGRTGELLADFQRRKRTSPRDIAPLLAIAEIYNVLEDEGARLDTIAEAARRQPGDTGLLIELARIEEEAGDYDGALASLQSAVKVDPGPKSRQKLADFYFRNGEIELGLAEVRGIQGDDPREIEKTVLGLNNAGEWQLALQYLAGAQRRDWRLDLLEAIAADGSGDKDRAREIFRALLRSETAIPGLKSMLDPDQYSERLDWASRNGAENPEFMIRYQLISDRLQQMRNGQGGGILPELPGSIEELYAYVLVCLVRDARELPEDERESLVEAIPFPPGDFGDRIRIGLRPIGWLEAEYEAGRIDLKTVVENFRWQEDSDLELIRKSVETFRESDPDLADRACQLLVRYDPENADKWMAVRLDLISKIEPEDLDQHLNDITNEVFRSGPSISFSDATRIRAREAMSEALLSVEPDTHWFSHYHWTTNALQEAWAEGDAEEVVKMMNLASNLPTPSSGAAAYQNRYRYRQNIELTIPPFPAVVGNIPIAVQKLFPGVSERGEVLSEKALKFYEDWTSANAKKSGGAPGDADFKVAFAPLFEKLENRALRVLAANWTADEERLAATVEVLEGSNEGQDLVLAAGYRAGVERDFKKAYALLSRARQLPMERAERSIIDGYLVGTALAVVDAGGDTGKLVSAQRAALRLQKVGQRRYVRGDLVAALGSLGLDGEQLRRARSFGSRQRGSAQMQARRSIAQAAASGNTEAVARNALRAGRAALARDPGRTYELENILERVSSPEARERIIELADPGGSRSKRRGMFFAQLCIALDKPERALDVVRALSAADPDDEIIRGLFLSVVPKDELSEDTLQLKGDEGGDAIVQLIKTVLGERAHYEITSPLFPRLLEVLTTHLEGMEPGLEEVKDGGSNYRNRRNITWATYLMQVVCGDVLWGDTELPEINEQQPKLEDGSLEPAAVERAAAARRLFEAGLVHPMAAGNAFVMLDGCSKAIGISDAELESAATQALATRIKFERTNNSIDWMLRSGRSGSGWGTPDEAGRRPSVFLASRIAGADPARRRALFQSLKRGLDEKQRTIIDLAEAISGLTDRPASDALEEAKRFCATSDRGENRMAENLHAFVEIGGGDLVGEVDQYLFSVYKAVLAGGSYVSPDYAIRAARSRASTQGSDASYSFISGVLGSFLGEEKYWIAWWPLREERGFPEAFRQRTSATNRFVDDILADGDAPVELIFALGKLPFPVFEEVGSEARRILRNVTKFSTKEECLEALADVGMWSRPWGELGLWIGDEAWATFWGVFINQTQVEGVAKSEVFDALMATEGDTVEAARKRFAGAFYKSDTGGSREKIMAAALNDLAPGLVTLTGADRTGLAEVVRSRFKDFKVPDASPELQEFFEDIGKELIGDVSELARSELEAGFDSVNFQYDDRERLTKRIVSLMSVDTPLAVEYTDAVLTALAERTKSPQRSRSISSSTTNNIKISPIDTYYRYVWREMREQDGLREQWFEFCSRLEESGAEKLVGFETFWLASRASFLDDYWERWEKQVEGREEGDKSFDPEVWMKMAEEYAKKDEVYRTSWREEMLLVALDRERQKMDAARCVTWLEETQFNETYPLEARAAYIQLATYEWDALDEKQRELAMGMLVAWLQDESISPRLRLEGVSLIIKRNSALTEIGEFTGGVCDALLDYAADGRPLLTPATESLLITLAKSGARVDSEKVLQVTERWNTALSGREGGTAFREPERAAPFAKALAIFAVNSGDMELALPMVRRDVGFFEGDIELMLELHAAGEIDTALRVAAPPGRPYRESNLKWDETVAKKAASLIKDVPDDAQRYRIECLVASLLEDGDGAAKERSARLVTLAETFAERAPEDENARIECLGWLLSDPRDVAVARPLAPMLMKIEEGWLFNQTLDYNVLGRDMAGALRKILDCAVWYAARENRDFAPAIRQLDDLFARGAEVGRSSFSSAIDQINSLLLEAIVGSFADGHLPADEVLALSKKSLPDTIALKYKRSSSAQRTFGLAFAAHILAGKSAEFSEWVGALEGEEAKRYQETIKSSPIRMFTTFGRPSGLVRSRGEGNPTLANLYVEAVAKDPGGSALVFTNLRDTQTLARYKYLDGEAVERMLAAEGSSLPRRGWWQVAREILRATLDRSDENRKTAITNLKALEDTSDAETANLAKIYRAEQIAVKRENREEAIEVIEGADLTVLDGQPREFFEKKIKQWKADVEKARKKKKEDETS